jgi:hypothetical protein
MTKNKNQHYVPAFYLYNFTNDEQRLASKGKPHRKTNIHHYDFDRKCLRERPIENVAIESYLLSHKNTDGSYDHSLDNEIKAVEDRAAKAIGQLNDILKYALTMKPRTVEIKNSIIDDVMELLFWQIKRHPEIVEELKKDCEQYLMENSRSTQGAKEMALEVIRQTGKDGAPDINNELHKKNKIILCTSTNNAHFITTDKPFVRFNKTGRNGIAVQDTEIYFPITSNMLLFMCNNGSRKEFRLENHRSVLRELNTYIGKSASRYLFGPRKTYLERIVKNLTNMALL